LRVLDGQKRERQSWIAAFSIAFQTSRLLDGLEFARFVLSGLSAACSNFLAVWLARRAFSYESSLVIGVTTGLLVSFALSKWYAFGSSSMQSVRSELIRFLAVYCAGSVIYWGVAVLASTEFRRELMSPATSETLGVVIGAGAMTLATYLGHRYFTYRTYKGPERDVSP
jgi:putative flippase GtrA